MKTNCIKGGFAVSFGDMIAHRKALICKSLGILAATAGMASCAKVEQNSVPADLTWQVIEDSPSTKASAYDTDDTFLSWAWYLPEGKTWSANKADAQRYIGGEFSGATIGYVSSKTAWKNVIKNGSSWDEGVTYYWPKAGSLTFFAASPSGLGSAVSCTTDGIKISDWDVDTHQDVDIMVADLAADQNTNTTSTGGWLAGVPTIFRHKLSMLVGFNFNTFKDYENGHDGSSEKKYTTSDITYLVKKIEISGFSQQGTYVVSSPSGESIGQWNVSATSPKYDYTWYENSTGQRIPYQSGGTAIPANSLGGSTFLYLLPQLFTTEDAKLRITYIKRTYKNDGSVDVDSNAETVAEVSLKELFASTGNRLVINRKITVNITFNNDSNLIFWAPDQTEWGSGDFEIYV